MLTDWSDTIGYVAAALVLTTFYMRSMVALRAFGLTSNIAFVAYGIQADLLPIILLHLALLPLNLIRLGEAVAHSGRSEGDGGAKEGS
ncbi:MAG TPA: cyclic nucleotide-binding protein [Rhizobiaceae bacterium]|nr:cyclic nucleotide-binding protein [Rhizobiaceae bacterium]